MANVPLMNGAPGCNCCNPCHATLCVVTQWCPCYGCTAGGTPPPTITISGPAGTFTYNGAFACNPCIDIDPADYGTYSVSGADADAAHTASASVDINACGTFSAVLDFGGGFHTSPNSLTLTLPDGTTLTMTKGGCGTLGPLGRFHCVQDTWASPYFGDVTFTWVYDYCSGVFSVCVGSGPGADGLYSDNPTPPGACENPIAKTPHVHPLGYTQLPDFDAERGNFCGYSNFPNTGTGASGALQSRFGAGPWDFLIDG